MTRIVYDVLQLVGLALLGAGAWAQWGWPVSLMIVGNTLMLMPLVDVLIVRRRAA